MELETFFNDCQAIERKYWKYCKEVKENPVRFPQKGETFLWEFFSIGHSWNAEAGKIKRKSDPDGIWYSADKETLMMFFLGSYFYREMGKSASMITEEGKEYLFPYIWYLLCLYYNYGRRAETQNLEKRGASGACLLEYLTKEYKEYAAKLCQEPREDLLKIFAAMADCLTGCYADEQVCYDEKPFLFMLRLADRMNPLRIWKAETNVLRKIRLTYEADSNIVRVEIEEELAQTEEGKNYIEGLRGAETGVQISIDNILSEEVGSLSESGLLKKYRCTY